jgi:hypothetical protein
MKNLLEEHRTKREKAIAEHKQNEFLRLKQEKQEWYNQFVSRVYAWHENYPYENTVNNLWYRTFSITPQELINNEINAIQAIKRSWGGVVMPAYYFSPIQFEYTQQAKNLEAEKAVIHQILRNEFIDILHKLYPNWYPVNFKDWPADSWGKRDVIDKGDYETIQANLPTYRRQLAEKLEAERLEAARIKAEQLKAQKLEEERLQAEKLKAQKLEAERLEAQRLELQRLETERIKGEQLKAQKLEEERLQAEKLELERLEAEQVYKQQLLTKELIEILPKLYPNYYPVNFENWPDDWGKTVINGRNFEAIEQQLPTYRRQLAEKLEAERLETQRLEVQRLQAEKMELERLELERIKAEQLKAQKLEEERLEAERLETERLQAEQLELERLELERLEVEQLETKRLEAEKLEAELGIGVSNNHDFVEVQLQSSFYDEYFQWSAEYQYDPSMFLK